MDHHPSSPYHCLAITPSQPLKARERQRETDRQRERQRQRERARARERERESDRDRETERERESTDYMQQKNKPIIISSPTKMIR